VYWVNDLESYKTLYVSPSYEKIWGRRCEDLYKSPADFINAVHPEDKELIFEAHKNVVNSHKTNIIYRILRPDGETRWISAKTNVIFDATGNKIEYGYAEDVTEKKNSDEKLLQINEQLRNLSSHLQNIREEERAKIAREIHDELGQQLTIIKMNLHSLLKKNKNTDIKFVEQAAEIGEYINQTIDTVRKIASDLRPVILDDFSLADSLQLHSYEFSKRTKIPCIIKVNGKETPSDLNISTQVFRIYQEALTNIARHSKATRVDSNVKSENGVMKLIIQDNGNGFNPEKISGKKSLGLIMMRERAIGIGGTLEIISAPGNGTTVLFSLPIK